MDRGDRTQGDNEFDSYGLLDHVDGRTCDDDVQELGEPGSGKACEYLWDPCGSWWAAGPQHPQHDLLATSLRETRTHSRAERLQQLAHGGREAVIGTKLTSHQMQGSGAGEVWVGGNTDRAERVTHAQGALQLGGANVGGQGQIAVLYARDVLDFGDRRRAGISGGGGSGDGDGGGDGGGGVGDGDGVGGGGGGGDTGGAPNYTWLQCQGGWHSSDDGAGVTLVLHLVLHERYAGTPLPSPTAAATERPVSRHASDATAQTATATPTARQRALIAATKFADTPVMSRNENADGYTAVPSKQGVLEVALQYDAQHEHGSQGGEASTMGARLHHQAQGVELTLQYAKATIQGGEHAQGERQNRVRVDRGCPHTLHFTLARARTHTGAPVPWQSTITTHSQ